MLRRTTRVFALVALLACTTVIAYALDTVFDVYLLIPSENLSIAPGEKATLHAKHLEEFSIEVTPKVGHVRYGSMRAMVNGESAATYTTISGTDAGYRCAVQLKDDGVVRLKPGANEVALDFTDTWNQPHHLVFTVTLPR